ncbi:hypothetical protein [Myroides sp. DF42-4-2]|uniref:hypothetical protein n=1 Tax=Myroides sp. DF42-4-2 TaxID=2746726 RepID=UPI002575F38D|nr:hypothetical protein [Myroides sp. DF42-4-2]
MICVKEGGEITASETMWGAMGKSLLTNLGHIGEFAFGFLAGRGGVGMVRGAVGATAGTAGFGQASMAFGKEFGRQFLNTAKKELIESFTFKGIRSAPWFCKTMRRLGIGGSYYDQYSIWSSDKTLLEKA